MPAAVVLPGYLASHTEGHGRIELAGAPTTVAEAFATLFARYPRLRDRVLTEQGQVRPHVNVFVDRRSIRGTGGLASPVAERAEIVVLPAVSGG